MSAFDGTQPTLRQSPPSRCRSTSATLAPRPAAPAAVTSPAGAGAEDHQVVACRGLRVPPVGRMDVADEFLVVPVFGKHPSYGVNGLLPLVHGLIHGASPRYVQTQQPRSSGCRIPSKSATIYLFLLRFLSGVRVSPGSVSISTKKASSRVPHADESLVMRLPYKEGCPRRRDAPEYWAGVKPGGGEAPPGNCTDEILCPAHAALPSLVASGTF